MNDSGIEQALANVAQHGIQVEVILPAASSTSGDSNSQGIATVKQSGVQVREDPQLYMHAKIIVVDNKVAFVGSENISTQSLDMLGFSTPQATPRRERGKAIGALAFDSTLESMF